MNVVIRADNLTKIYKSASVLNRKQEIILENLNLEVYESEVFGLLGLNGAGKTTLMKIFLGLVYPTRGQAWVLGKSVGHKDIRREIGFLPEMPYFSRYSSPQEILTYYARLYGFDNARIRSKVDEVLEIVGLIKKRKTPLKEFSKGMLQRVGMAQLIINNPRLVFLDEPTFGLDPLACKEMRDLILMMKKEKKTVFLSSHQISEIEKVCDRIGVLHSRKIVKVSTVKYPLEDLFVETVSKDKL